MRNVIRVVLADDHEVTRAGIRTILENASDIKIVGEASTGAEAKAMTANLRPHVLLLDLQMPGPRPAQIEAWVRAHYPETITLVLTAHDRDAYLSEMVEAGVAGFISKTEAGHQLVGAIRRAARGIVLLSEEQLQRARRWRREVGRRWEQLTPRERDVLRLLVAGHENAAIAETLTITLRTVEYHVSNILHKLGVSSRLEAATWVREHLPDDLWKRSPS
jgi:DNA-binding NarL/FixJ family response regulator